MPRYAISRRCIDPFSCATGCNTAWVGLVGARPDTGLPVTDSGFARCSVRRGWQAPRRTEMTLQPRGNWLASSTRGPGWPVKVWMPVSRVFRRAEEPLKPREVSSKSSPDGAASLLARTTAETPAAYFSNYAPGHDQPTRLRCMRYRCCCCCRQRQRRRRRRSCSRMKILPLDHRSCPSARSCRTSASPAQDRVAKVPPQLFRCEACLQEHPSTASAISEDLSSVLLAARPTMTLSTSGRVYVAQSCWRGLPPGAVVPPWDGSRN